MPPHPYLLETRGPDPVRIRVDLPEINARPCTQALSSAMNRAGAPIGRILRLLTVTDDRNSPRATFAPPGKNESILTLSGPAALALKFTVPEAGT